MELQEYQINEETKEVILRYVCEEKQMHIYISKDYAESSINFKIDGTANEIIKMSALRMDVPVYQYRDSNGNMYYQVSFEYLNTYYSISGLMDEEEFKQILENIIYKKCIKMSKRKAYSLYICRPTKRGRKGGDHWVRDNLQCFLQASVY